MKVLVVDDHALIREALQAVLGESKPGVSVLEAADSSQAKMLVAANADLELLFLDLSLPDGDGLVFLETLRVSHPSIGVVVLSASKDRDSVTRALNLGAVGFIPKSATRAVMLGAIRLILAGGIYVPPEVLAPQDDVPPTGAEPQRRAASKASPTEVGLTSRQVDVLALMMQGKSNKAICRELNIAEATVKTYVTAILKALNASNRTEAVVAASEHGWTVESIRG